MKKWSEFSGAEKRMMITIGVLVLLILVTSGRVTEGIRKGFHRFFSTPADTVQTDR